MPPPLPPLPGLRDICCLAGAASANALLPRPSLLSPLRGLHVPRAIGSPCIEPARAAPSLAQGVPVRAKQAQTRSPKPWAPSNINMGTPSGASGWQIEQAAISSQRMALYSTLCPQETKSSLRLVEIPLCGTKSSRRSVEICEPLAHKR